MIWMLMALVGFGGLGILGLGWIARAALWEGMHEGNWRPMTVFVLFIVGTVGVIGFGSSTAPGG